MAEKGSEACGLGIEFPFHKLPEGVFEDDVIYVTLQQSSVRLKQGRIVVSIEGTESASFPLEQVRCINIFGNVSVSTPLLHSCSENKMHVHYFTFYGKYLGSFEPVLNTIAMVRRRQCELDHVQQCAIASRMIRAKIRNCRTILSRKGIQGLDRLKILESTCEAASDLSVLRGIEGEAASLYFGYFDEILPDDWSFARRSRRPPADHFNSLLSLTYSLFLNEVISALRQYNLDPFIGVLHADRHGKPSLALDLLEEFRPIFCDAFSFRLVNKRMITHDDFLEDNHLNQAAFKRYLSYYDDYVKEVFTHPTFHYHVSRRKSILLQVILLRKAIVGEMKLYHSLMFMR